MAKRSLNLWGHKISTLSLNNTNLLILGAWNDAILGDPSWLIENISEIAELIKQVGNDPVVEFQVFPQRMRVNLHKLAIIPAREILIIEPCKSDDDIFHSIGAVGKSILNKLPHTPIRAIGHNFVFTLDTEESFSVEYSDQNNTLSENVSEALDCKVTDSTSQVKSTFELENTNYQLNVTIEPSPEGKKLSVNFHHPITNKSKDNITEIIESFADNFELSKKILNTMVIR